MNQDYTRNLAGVECYCISSQWCQNEGK